MVNNRLLLGFVAFGISFGITLLVNRDGGRALATGLTTLPAVYIAVAIATRRYDYQLEDRIATLKNHIYALQQRRRLAYEEFVEMMEEKEQIALSLNSMQLQLQQLQLPGASSASLDKPPLVSWNLSDRPSPASDGPLPPHALPTQLQNVEVADPELSQFLAETSRTKRKIEANLNRLQAELAQVKVEITEARQTRDRLTQEIADLDGQKQQLTHDIPALQSEVQELETCRKELEQFLSYAESKKQELETGAHPLQVVLKQLQAQTNAVAEELYGLEAQIESRKHERDELNQQMGQLDQPAQQPASSRSKSSQAAASSGNGSLATKGTSSRERSSSKSSKSSLVSGNSSPHAASVALPNLPKAEEPASDLPPEWTELMVQLPEYEFQVLKAIAEQANPIPVIKRIAEESLTMPELLIDGINERALDTVGDLIIESEGSVSAIVREHTKIVKKLITAYESLL